MATYSSEDAVTSLLSHALHRSPSPSELEEVAGLPAPFDRALTYTLESDEGLRHASWRLLRTTLRNVDVTGTTIVSLGTQCYTSSCLQQLGLKQASMPFDWIFSSPEMIEHAITDGFKTFLDPQFYTRAPRDDDWCTIDHEYYKAKYSVVSMFNHRNVMTPDDYAYLVRTVDRFRALGSSGHSVRFLMVTPWASADADYFERITRLLTAHVPGSFLHLVKVQPPVRRSTIEETAKSEAGCLTMFSPSSHMLGTNFADPIDDIVLMSYIVQRAF